ncbi:adenosylcobinamide-phosphate synthase CbiB [Konateibacter massiliensis]|uniref:adenosylcobinamide-phosphate synthase CbiB n=1 Tax=Konateibacter massiliensis TaxID=2002841 RepID=UPI000C15E9F2|nr:adenosylcobinamide-phosphate synthase CbiB [Konateibacter massiliensis]
MLSVILGFVIDMLIGDPFGKWHPICAIGNLISFLKKGIRKRLPKSKSWELAGGALLVIVTVSLSAAVPFLILYLCFSINRYLGFFVETIMCYQILATKSLKTESMKVYHAFLTGDTEQARTAVSMIVGRDTSVLDRKGIVKATVETVAENTTDGVIAPLFYLMLGGPVLGFAYKAVNTLDSMVGYKNEENLYFGRISAKLDDILNYIPARMSGLLMVAAAFLGGFDGKQSWKIFVRDRYNHASPNSAQTEAACAGALNIMLAGNAYYFGKLYEKKTIGDDNREIEPEDIKKVNKLMYTTALLGLIIVFSVRFLFAL